jgi:hypothetical protein
MTPSTPIKLTFYNPETNEVKEEHVTYIVPWGILKRSMSLAKIFGSGRDVDIDTMNPDDMDVISGWWWISLAGSSRSKI